MDRFAFRPSYLIKHRSNSFCLRVHSLRTPDEAYDATIALLRASLPDEFTLNVTGPHSEDLAKPPPPEKFADKLPDNPVNLVDPVTHWTRIAAMQAKLDALKVTGLSEFESLPAGWLSVMEALADGWSESLGSETDAQVSISQIKEKFGTLRIYTSSTGSDEFMQRVEQICQWAEAATEARCMVTGRRGYQSENGWILTLCAEAMVWRLRFPEQFRMAMYPQKPRAAQI